MSRERVIQAFENYVKAYDLGNPNIYLKYVHTGKVASNCEQIAISLDLCQEDIDIAWEIGMLHDIGRFEQLRRFDTFNDAVSLDHAQFGADILFKEGLIENTGIVKEHYDIIEQAIRNHSCYRLPDGLSDREKMFCQIIRDADKVDIFRANYETGIHVVYHVTREELTHSEITPEVYEVFLEERAIPRQIKKTVADHLVGHLALAYELIYPESKKMMIEQGYYQKLMQTEFDNPRTKETLKAIRERMEQYLMK